MAESAPNTTLNCTQCGGELHPEPGQFFLTCPYCNAAVYLDRSQVVFHWYLSPTLDEAKARGALARWMAGNETVKDLDKKSRLQGASFEYFPVWYFKCRRPNGSEVILLEPAAATSVSEIRRLSIPAGDMHKYDPAIESQAQTPDVPLDTALGWLAQRSVKADEIRERGLVHLPLFSFKYSYQSRIYTALVEAATGGVIANIYPAKSEAPYRTIAVVTALVYLCLAILPLFGGLASDAEGFGLGLVGCVGLGLALAPVLFGVAAWIASKV